jgi:HAD superfamily hydrolase (TIGR01549 family)
MDKNITVIIFDFDGVISQSVNIKTEAFEKIYKPYGVEVVKKVKAHHLANGGMSRFEKFKIYHGDYLKIKLKDKQIIELSKEFSKNVVKKIVKAPYVPGAYEFIRKYFKKYTYFLITATPQNEIENIVKLKGLDKYFVRVLGSPLEKHENINRILNQYKLDKSEVCYIGDSLNDYTASKRCGIKFIGLGLKKMNPFPHKVTIIKSFEILL